MNSDVWKRNDVFFFFFQQANMRSCCLFFQMPVCYTSHYRVLKQPVCLDGLLPQSAADQCETTVI